MAFRARHCHAHASQPTVLSQRCLVLVTPSWATPSKLASLSHVLFLLQFCTFGSRQIGRGYYVFDSRWNRLRCALNLMVEKHLNAQLWK